MNAQIGLTPRQKAAVIVRLLLGDDEAIGLDKIDDKNQTLLAEEMARMQVVNRSTRDAVIDEFCTSLEDVGVVFPGDIDGTIAILENKFSNDTTDRLKRFAIVSGRADPWERVISLPQQDLQKLADSEAAELVAVMLSKLPVDVATNLFAGLPREKARVVAQTMAMTEELKPDALLRIGRVLALAADALPSQAIEEPTSERMGEILNFAAADLRDDVLEALDSEDQDFADRVRRAIFIFAHMPKRILVRDIPRIVRDIDQPVLIRALAGKTDEDRAAADYILSNMSQRMADGLREEIEALGDIKAKAVEEAGAEVVSVIRRLVAEGEITLKPLEVED